MPLLELYIKDSNTMMVAQVYDDLGYMYQQKDDPDSALFYHKRAIEIGESVQDYKNLSTYYYDAANVYADLKKYKDAKFFAAKSLEKARQQKNSNYSLSIGERTWAAGDQSVSIGAGGFFANALEGDASVATGFGNNAGGTFREQ